MTFQAFFRTRFSTLAEVERLSAEDQQNLLNSEILPLMDYLFGPLVNRLIGSPQRSTHIEVSWSGARLNHGSVEVPFAYNGTWLLIKRLASQESFELPLPYNRDVVFSTEWKNCTDSDPDHQTRSFYWYFWDPRRFGCDQKEGEHFQTIRVSVGQQTQNTDQTYPDYRRMTEDGSMTITLGFGYVKDPATPKPETDYDAGAREYQSAIRQIRSRYGTFLSEEQAIRQADYRYGRDPNLQIGHRFSGKVGDKNVIVNVVMAAGVDQMEIFAKSFAHDHDDFFGWFGHSRVGSGFDAMRFEMMVKLDPTYFSIANNFQIIYWAGCNSYSYYTLPFFEFKGGSQNLNIIANGLPSYFSLNAANALTALDVFLRWQERLSYQFLVRSLESQGAYMGTTILVSVLGDETNPP